MNSEILKALSKDDLLVLIQAQLVQAEAQAAQIGALTARIAELEARLYAPRKTPGNSGTPPFKGRKPNRPERTKTPRRAVAPTSPARWRPTLIAPSKRRSTLARAVATRSALPTSPMSKPTAMSTCRRSAWS